MSTSNRFPQDDRSPRRPENSFQSADQASLAAHLKQGKFGDFELTDAVRPAMDLKIQPTEGYRHEIYVDEESRSQVPVVMAAASSEKLFSLFMQLIQKLGPVVDVVLESSHERTNGQHVDLYREQIEIPILSSILWDYEDLLLNDGCTGIAVLNPHTPQEIQFEEHKLLIMYGSPLEQFEFVLEQQGLNENQKMKFITEAEHIHSTTDAYERRFEQLRTDLGLDGTEERQDFETGQDGETESWGDSWDDGAMGGAC